MTRVLVTTDTLGGVWRYTTELATAWAEAGHEIVVATLGPAPDPSQRLSLADRRGVTLTQTDEPLDWTAPDAGALRRASDRLASLAREQGVGRVHLHAPALVGEADWPAPVVTVVHSCLRTWWRAMRGTAPLPPDLGWRDAATLRGLRRADATIAPGLRFGRDVADAYDLSVDAIHGVPNGVDPAPAHAGAGFRSRAVLGCGRAWDEAKDVTTLERAARRLPSDIAVRFAGALQGPNGERAPPLGRVQALGSMPPPALARLRADARVFVSTARYEPFGLAILEAAQSGLALVLADLPSLREHWDGAALFFPPGDDAALARLVLDALEDPLPPAERAFRRALRFTSRRMADATAAVHGF